MKPSRTEQYFAYSGYPLVQKCVVCGKAYRGNATKPHNVGYGRYREFPAHKKCGGT